MGKGIKTRVSEKKGIKAIDKAAVASERMKEAYIRTKDKADHSLYAEESSPGEYASDRLSAGVDNVTHEAVHQFDKQGRKGVQTTKENISKVKEKIQKRKAAAEQPKKQAEKQAARQAGQPTTRWSGAVKRFCLSSSCAKTAARSQTSSPTSPKASTEGSWQRAVRSISTSWPTTISS